VSTQDRPAGTAIVPLPAPDEQMPSGPLWTLLDADGDGVIVASQSDQRVALTARAMTTWGTATLLRLSPAGARAAAAALLAAADHAEQPEATR
jgi:phage tail sheath gpL-like